MCVCVCVFVCVCDCQTLMFGFVRFKQGATLDFVQKLGECEYGCERERERVCVCVCVCVCVHGLSALCKGNLCRSWVSV